MPHVAFLQANLECQQQCEQKLVVLVESSARILEHFKCEAVNDAINAFAGYGGVV